MVRTPIPNLRGTPMHVMAVELYQGHHDDASGACVRCGERAPCPTRAHAASVIAAAREDPRWYDGRLSAPGSGQPSADERPTAPPDFGRTDANHTGSRVGGRGARDDPTGFLYEREPEW